MSKSNDLEVVAHIRRTQTPYDSLLALGYDRRDARAEIRGQVGDVTDAWQGRLEEPQGG